MVSTETYKTHKNNNDDSDRKSNKSDSEKIDNNPDNEEYASIHTETNTSELSESTSTSSEISDTEESPESSKSESDDSDKVNPESKQLVSGMPELKQILLTKDHTSGTPESKEQAESRRSDVEKHLKEQGITPKSIPTKDELTSVQISKDNYTDALDNWDLSETENIYFKEMFPATIDRLLKQKCAPNKLKGLFIDGLQSLKNEVYTESPADIGKFKQVEFPTEIRQFKKLEYLHIKNSKLSAIPEWINELTNLISFQIEDSQLKEFPNIKKLKKLERLSFDGNSIEAIPDWISDFKNLETLSLSDNILHSFNKNIAKLKNLRHLLMLSNELKELPEQIKSLAPSYGGNLEEINIAQNKFREYPSALKILKGDGVHVVADSELIKTDSNLLIQDILARQDLDYEYLMKQDFSQLVFLNINCKNLTETQLINILNKCDSKKLIGLTLDEANRVPDIIKNFINLKKLKIEHSSLEEFPDFISNMMNLQEIHFAHNIIKEVPFWIKTLDKLEVLDLYDNLLKSLPRTIEEAPKLRVLNIGKNNFFSSLPSEVLKIKQLNELYVRNLDLKNLPKGISDLKKLQVLDLYDNRLSNLPSELKELTKMKVLNLGKNRLRALPNVIKNLNNLESLYLSDVSGTYRNKKPINLDCNFIWTLSNLKNLDLSQNHLGTIQKNFTNLKELRKLNLSGCVFKGAETAFSQFKHLEELNLSEAQWELGQFELRTRKYKSDLLPRKEIETYYPDHTISAISTIKTLKILDLSGLKWTGKYTEYLQYIRRKEDVVSNLYTLPKKLEVLKLEKNGITEFPKILRYSPNLLELSLANNNIRELPNDMEHLSCLHSLDISGNKIEKLSNNISDLTYLRKLNLADNLLTVLPNEIGKLNNLQVLNISQNDISDAPYDLINKLEQLEELNVQFNNFSFDPTKIDILLKKLHYKNDSQNLTIKLSEYNEKKSTERIIKNAVGLRIVCDIKDNVLKYKYKDNGHIISVYTDPSKVTESILKKCNPNIIENIEISHCPNNIIEFIMPELSRFSNLKSLNFSYCNISNFDRYISFPKLKVLDLTGNKLSKIPNWVEDLHELEELYLADNKIRKLPSWIGNLKHLRILSIGYNLLTDLDDKSSIWDLCDLQFLDINANKLEKLSPKIGQLQNLQTLLASGNKLIDLPSELADLPNIKRVSVNNNLFKDEPDEKHPIINHINIVNTLTNKGVHVETYKDSDIEQIKEKESEEE